MDDIPQKLTFRLGALRKPLGKWCELHGKKPSQAIRQAIAEMLAVEPPPMDGNIKTLEKINKRRRKK